MVYCPHGKDYEEILRNASIGLSGDEFCVILSGSDYDERDRLMKRMDMYNEDGMKTDSLTIACGMSEFRTGQDDSIQTVFERADSRMYENKSQMKMN